MSRGNDPGGDPVGRSHLGFWEMSLPVPVPIPVPVRKTPTFLALLRRFHWRKPQRRRGRRGWRVIGLNGIPVAVAQTRQVEVDEPSQLQPLALCVLCAFAVHKLPSDGNGSRRCLFPSARPPDVFSGRRHPTECTGVPSAGSPYRDGQERRRGRRIHAVCNTWPTVKSEAKARGWRGESDRTRTSAT
jgi:hypothetical protein